MDTVKLQNITKTFGEITAVNNLSLSVPERSIYGFIGPNGSGKTTTLRMIMNIYYPDAGDIIVLGDRITGAASDRIGYMPEERGLYKNMKVRDLLKFYGDLKNGKDLKRKADSWLERFELTDYADKKVETLSKGMSQKIQFISTIVAEPDLLILDEPFSGLDPVNAEVIKDAILDLNKSGTTVIFSTHDMNVAEKMCDFIFMIYKGEKVLDGTLESIQNEYGDDTIRIKTTDGIKALENLAGVEKITDFGQQQELRIAKTANHQDILKEIINRTSVNSFDLIKPSLHDIFIRIARPQTEDQQND